MTSDMLLSGKDSLLFTLEKEETFKRLENFV
jgi:hypothetical protein